MSNKKLKNLSERDKLTNLYNRLKFDKVISQEIEYAKRYNRIFSLVLCDIDYFKNINDTYGHNFGDEVLVAFSKLLIQNLRKIDYVFRWGGDEFIILLPETNKFEAHKVAEKLKRKILQDKFLKKINLTASFGVEEYKKGLSIDEVIELADKALYKSKENGRNMIS
ncbi:hypothetical protein XO10_01490 [Marinitoga sp. 1135]|nr:hypothetical protein LN42_01435 [Marinitoga sp. 1137]NUU95353.1 hypothetical protein [Marinitoga sp. 1135]NUU96983.1 hypothetical protein [Marinitoga sp. 1138]